MKDTGEYEFLKLKKADQQILFWMIDNSPERIEDWLNFLSGSYEKEKTTSIEVHKLLAEIKDATFKNEILKKRKKITFPV